MAPLAHADPAEAQTPSSSRTTSSSSASTPSTPRLQIGVDPVASRHRLVHARNRSGDAVEQTRRELSDAPSRRLPVARHRLGRRCHRHDAGDVLRPGSAFALLRPTPKQGPQPSRPGTRHPGAVTSAPTPFGPPNL